MPLARVELEKAFFGKRGRNWIAKRDFPSVF